MPYMSRKWHGMTISANQHWWSICITPSLSYDWTGKNDRFLKNKWRRITITLAWIAWWVSLEIMWGE